MKKKKTLKKIPATAPPFVQIAVSGAHDWGENGGFSAVLYGLDKNGRIWWLEDDGDSDGWERVQINIYNAIEAREKFAKSGRPR